MKEWYFNGNRYQVYLKNDKKVNIDSKWVDTACQKLDIDVDTALEMWLEDNDYLKNEEQNELDSQAKQNKVKLDTDKKERKKVVRERKPNVNKIDIITLIDEFLHELQDFTDVKVENVSKIITFKYKNKEFKLDLTEKRTKKCE